MSARSRRTSSASTASEYRGRLKLIVNRDGRSFDAINLVPLEPYLAGVVGEEMPDYWEPQALRAQAIAARTYCLFIKNRFGTNRSYDVSRTQSSQVYGGVARRILAGLGRGEQHVRQGRRDRPGRAAGRSPRFGLRHARAAACSRRISAPSAAGIRADSEDVFGDSFGPLKGVPCPYCKDVAKLGLFYWPMAQFDRETVTKQLIAAVSQARRAGRNPGHRRHRRRAITASSPG